MCNFNWGYHPNNCHRIEETNHDIRAITWNLKWIIISLRLMWLCLLEAKHSINDLIWSNYVIVLFTITVHIYYHHSFIIRLLYEWISLNEHYHVTVATPQFELNKMMHMTINYISRVQIDYFTTEHLLWSSCYWWMRDAVSRAMHTVHTA